MDVCMTSFVVVVAVAVVGRAAGAVGNKIAVVD